MCALSFGVDDIVDYKGTLINLWNRVALGDFNNEDYYVSHYDVSLFEYMLVNDVKNIEKKRRRATSKLSIAGMIYVYRELGVIDYMKKINLLKRIALNLSGESLGLQMFPLTDFTVSTLSLESFGEGKFRVYDSIPRQLYGIAQKTAMGWGLHDRSFRRLLVIFGALEYDNVRKKFSIRGNVKDILGDYIDITTSCFNLFSSFINMNTTRIDYQLKAMFDMHGDLINDKNPELYASITEVLEGEQSSPDDSNKDS